MLMLAQMWCFFLAEVCLSQYYEGIKFNTAVYTVIAFKSFKRQLNVCYFKATNNQIIKVKK